ncbi:MAG: PfkB family carbohydrate kinase [Propionibacteriaceae bacterium]|jgi:sugar/nucleoside kinase (ribokinase family)|nr:PfkB family carbohydrate kinase [Propionibacteriaceae bacterium]
MLGVIGDISEDILVYQSAPLAHGSDAPSRVVRSRGGSAANLAAAAAPLLPVRFIGCVGSDAHGRAVTEALQREGVDVRVRIGSRSCTIVILVSPDGERTMLPDRAANAELSDVPNEWLDDLDALHITTYSLEGGPTTDACIAAMACVKARGGLTSLDTSSAAILKLIGVEPFEALVTQLDPDIIFANELEAEVLGWDVDEPAERLLVIKHGGDPVLFRNTQGSARIPVPPVTGVIDFTGAGDGYAAGFLAAVLAAASPITPQDLRNIDVQGPELAAWCAAAHVRASALITQPGAGVEL